MLIFSLCNIYFSKQILCLPLASVKKDIGCVPLLFVSLNGGKGVISDSGHKLIYIYNLYKSDCSCLIYRNIQ